MSPTLFPVPPETAPACRIAFNAARIIGRRVLDTLTADLARLDKALADTCEDSYVTRLDLNADRRKLGNMIVALRDAADQHDVFVNWSEIIIWDGEWNQDEDAKSDLEHMLNLHDNNMSKYAESITALREGGFTVDTAYYIRPYVAPISRHDPLDDLDDAISSAVAL